MTLSSSAASIPFMVTNAMKDALRHRGLADADIER